jgi:hypothetical protein
MTLGCDRRWRKSPTPPPSSDRGHRLRADVDLTPDLILVTGWRIGARRT